MPSIGAFHPQIVHFAIALLVAGVVFRWVSLSGRAAFTGPAAASLLLLGTLAAAAAAKSGTDAHGPVERVPGARQAVVDHENWGERTRNVFYVVAVLELVGIVVRRKDRARPVLLASAAIGTLGLGALYVAGARGGELVYSYAGGVGIRSGDPADVERLLLAGLYHQAQTDRKAGRGEEAAVLIELLAHRHPADLEIQLLAAESVLLDRRNAPGAVEALSRISVPETDRRLRFRHAFLTADALLATGQKDGARAVLQTLLTSYPEDARLKRKLEEFAK